MPRDTRKQPFAHGSRNRNAVLTADQVREVRRRYDAGDNCAKIHRELNWPFSLTTITSCAKRHTYQDIE